VGESSDERLDALARFERADAQCVALGQVEGVGDLVGVRRNGELGTHRPTDDAQAVSEGEEFGELAGHAVGRHDDAVGVLEGALGHGLVPADAARGEGLGVSPRDGVVDGDDRLCSRVERTVVPVQGGEQAGRMDHAAPGEADDAALPRQCQFAATER
jgi:hypothetical protein